VLLAASRFAMKNDLKLVQNIGYALRSVDDTELVVRQFYVNSSPETTNHKNWNEQFHKLKDFIEQRSAPFEVKVMWRDPKNKNRLFSPVNP
jgi:hypothetical protein